MNHTHFFLSPLLVYDGTELKLAMHRALVSRSGIYKVFEECEETNRAFLAARVYRVRLDGTDFRARLVRESGPAGTHYNLQLIDFDKELEIWLQDLLSRCGFESPWKRDYSRISVEPGTLEADFPTRLLLDSHQIAEVKNFSYHGMFVELKAPATGGETVGQKISFRIATHKGEVLKEAVGRVARIYDEVEAPGKLKRGLGIRLLEIKDGDSRKAYHWMILDACRELQWVPIGLALIASASL